MVRGGRYVSAAAVLAAILAGSVQATPITWEFSGVLTVVQDYGGLPSDVVVGMPFTGSYTFDSSIHASSGYMDIKATYPTGPAAMQIQIGDYAIVSGADNYISVENSEYNDVIDLGALDLDTPFGFATEWNVVFLDSDSEILSNTDLPLAPPPLAPLERHRMTGQGYDFWVQGEVLVLVPEPQSFVLGVVAAGGVVWRRRARVLD